MNKPTSNHDSIYRVIIAHYITAAIFFLIVCVSLAFSSEAFIGHYFHPKILAITHLTTLGWITFIIMGSLYQLVPVITNKKIHSSIIASVVYFFMLIGTVLLAISFWSFNTGLLIEFAACFLFLGITLFLINILLTVRGANEKNIELDFIQTSIFWLWLTAFIGSLLAFNFRYPFLPKEHLYYLKIHAHIGLIGWFLCLIIGVAIKLIPMFLLSGKLNTKPLTYCYYIININLIALMVDSLFLNGQDRFFVYILIIFLGIVFFLNFIAKAFRTRARKKLDISLKHIYLSFLSIAIPMVLWVVLKTEILSDNRIEIQISTAIVFSLLFGFITLLILGQTFKNLAFIAWMKKYQNCVGKVKTLLPKDLYSEQIITFQLYVYITGFIITLYGIIDSNTLCIKFGSFFLIGTAILYLINVFKIVLHKTKI